MEHSPDQSQLLRLARSPEGQALYALLRSTDPSALSRALEQAAAGDYDAARQALAAVLADPQAQDLLRRLEQAP